MHNKDEEFSFLIAFGILTILNLVNFFLVFDQYNRHHNKKSLTKKQEDIILFINRILYITLALYFFYYNKKQYEQNKNSPDYIVENSYKEVIVSFLLLTAALINLTDHNYEIEDIYH